MASLLAARAATRTLALRAVSHGSVMPNPARIQLPKPSENGYFAYTRNWSRDRSMNLSHAPQKGDTPLFFLLRRLGHAYEVYPLFVLTAAWMALFAVFVGTAFTKMEVWLDRSKDTAPWDWARIHDKYWKMHTVMFDWDGRTHRRLEIMEQLQDEMAEAAKKRRGG